jgi:hypothetical protein
MKELMIVLIALTLTAGFAFAKEYSIVKQSGDYTVTINMDKNPPVAGDNKAQISIQDKTGLAITDATVEIDYSMPAMMGMPAMNYKATTEIKDKKYNSTLKFSMSGAWAVAVKITRAGKIQTVKFNIDIS